MQWKPRTASRLISLSVCALVVFQLEALHQKIRAAGIAMNVIQRFARAVDDMTIETRLA